MDHEVFLSGTLLIINPITYRSTSLLANVSPRLVCGYTFSTLKSRVPEEVHAVFLSSRQSQQETLSIFTAIQSIKASWQVSFYFKNIMLDRTLTAWKGKEENTVTAKEAFFRM
ncbi:hypothetical protein ARALYDRAFT_899267 [Arabidopsis lyrata subsp. lyrata]|uniref:fructose-bisphosphate aldolase n=1 Tax=Arabidopsis lyrata subsp. lyrata TaxID=81972 RepID=D7L831_ARALL|nr:hypothetical protein ARALYDRAFT_899267 [Arabidopsis lyrata subsp. lyrata]